MMSSPKAQREGTARDFARRLHQTLEPLPFLAGSDRSAAEHRAEVEQVATDVAATAFVHQHVERVDALGVDVVEPRGEHSIGAQLASMLVIDDVVRVVFAGRIEADPAHRLPRRGLAENHAVGAVGVAIGLHRGRRLALARSWLSVAPSPAANPLPGCTLPSHG